MGILATASMTDIAAIVVFSEWEERITLILGLWLIAAPWLLGFPHAASMKVSIGVGIVVADLAQIELWLIHYGSDRVGSGQPPQPTSNAK